MADNKNYGLSISTENLPNEVKSIVDEKDLGIQSGKPLVSPTSHTFVTGFSNDITDSFDQVMLKGVHNFGIPEVTPTSQPFTSAFSSDNYSSDTQDALGATGIHFGRIAVPPTARPDSDGHFASTIASGLGLSAENYTQNTDDVLGSERGLDQAMQAGSHITSNDQNAIIAHSGANQYGVSSILNNLSGSVTSDVTTETTAQSAHDILGGARMSAGGINVDMPAVDSSTSANAGSFLNDCQEDSRACATNAFDNMAEASATAEKNMLSYTGGLVTEGEAVSGGDEDEEDGDADDEEEDEEDEDEDDEDANAFEEAERYAVLSEEEAAEELEWDGQEHGRMDKMMGVASGAEGDEEMENINEDIELTDLKAMNDFTDYDDDVAEEVKGFGHTEVRCSSG